MRVRVAIHMRPGCHLCDEAESAVREAIGPETQIELVDIEQDDDLHRRDLERIPVILVDGVEFATLIDYRHPDFADNLRQRLNH